MRFDAFEIDGGKIVFCSATGQTLLFDIDDTEKYGDMDSGPSEGK